ncbi:hypothetical protein U1Q18_025467 [Sarracenia purpurea var. burkii]
MSLVDISTLGGDGRTNPSVVKPYGKRRRGRDQKEEAAKLQCLKSSWPEKISVRQKFLITVGEQNTWSQAKKKTEIRGFFWDVRGGVAERSEKISSGERGGNIRRISGVVTRIAVKTSAEIVSAKKRNCRSRRFGKVMRNTVGFGILWKGIF